MTSSSNPPLERGLDTMFLVYSLLQGHPAQTACEQMLRAHSGWFTSSSVLFEAKHILTKTYGESPILATQKLAQVAAGPIVLLELDSAGVAATLGLADAHGVDLTDAALLHLAQSNGAIILATDDHRLSQVCASFGITAISPLGLALRQQVAAWEAAHVPPKGVTRILRRVHQWLSQSHSQAAQDFWTQTKGGSHLP